MFGIGLPELIVIMGIALIVVGPEKLPELARSLGKQMIQLKRTAQELKDSLEDEMGDQDFHQAEEDIVKLPSEPFEEEIVDSEDEAAAEEASTEPVASSESILSEEEETTKNDTPSS